MIRLILSNPLLFHHPQVAEAVETGVPTQLSYGFVSGFCSGFALKKVGKVVGVVLGVGFMGLQTLSYSGYVDVDHDWSTHA